MGEQGTSTLSISTAMNLVALWGNMKTSVVDTQWFQWVCTWAQSLQETVFQEDPGLWSRGRHKHLKSDPLGPNSIFSHNPPPLFELSAQNCSLRKRIQAYWVSERPPQGLPCLWKRISCTFLGSCTPPRTTDPKHWRFSGIQLLSFFIWHAGRFTWHLWDTHSILWRNFLKSSTT